MERERGRQWENDREGEQRGEGRMRETEMTVSKPLNLGHLVHFGRQRERERDHMANFVDPFSIDPQSIKIDDFLGSSIEQFFGQSTMIHPLDQNYPSLKMKHNKNQCSDYLDVTQTFLRRIDKWLVEI